MLKVIYADLGSIQRHRPTIVECLKDSDVSLKRRAMELCFALINKHNITEMTDELIDFLSTCEPEFKADCSSNLFIAMEKYAPNRRWHIDQMTRVLKTAGNNVRDDIVSSFITLVSNTPEFQYYAMHQLVELIKDDVTQQPLVQVAAWCLGEYGDQYSREQNVEKLDDSEIVNILVKVLNYNAGVRLTRYYAINSLVKLTTRFPHLTDKIQSVMSVYGCNMSLELQQRAVEYNSIIRNQPNLRDGLFEQMPPMEMKTNQPYTNGFNADDLENQEILTEEEQQQQQIKQQQEAAKTLLNIFNDDAPVGTSPRSAAPQSNFDLLGDLMSGEDSNQTSVIPTSMSSGFDDLLGLSGSVPATNVMAPSPKIQSPVAKQAPSTDIFDLLGEGGEFKPSNGISHISPSSNTHGLNDLLGLGSSNTPSQTPQSTSNSTDLFDLLGGPVQTTSISPKTPTNVFRSSSAAKVVAYDKNNIQITFEPTINAGMNSSPSTQHFLTMTATNTSLSGPVFEFVFGAAVPKSMKMQLSQPKTSVIQPMESMHQTLAISNPNKVILAKKAIQNFD